ncbi:SIR2 family protein [Siccirubricoccus phaeus]|uniref:SIR2 family protein n=1 Tax=Siccirubricoccus phaeus TaxID=2595053 RepID=UPI0011F0FA6F|nr:SIR2 family protein [Siccirubricoccus phaeus]
MTDEKTAPASQKYARYIEEVSEDISETVRSMGCQPILFVGSGLSKRYMNAPNWDELLAHIAASCSDIKKELGFYKQAYRTAPAIGEEFARIYQEWAWGAGRNEFPKTLFEIGADSQVYLKFKISEHLRSVTPPAPDKLNRAAHGAEIDSFVNIRPHAIITTNYDRMLEMLFPEHEPVIGQKILRGQQFSIGEIFKIHGCVSNVNSLVIIESDYRSFERKKKFLSAKLLTFFNEHPLLFVGYSASDPNIRAILADIDEALPEKGGIVPNVYILQWNPSLTNDSSPAKERVIATEDDRTIRVKLIETTDFSWVFDAFAANPTLNNVSPRVLRALLARSYHLVRHDIPSMPIQADFKTLTDSVADSNSFAKLFGIAYIDDWSAASAHHIYSPTQLGKLLGGNGWHFANELLERMKNETGVDVKISDNRYHRTEMVNTTKFHKYSKDALNLLVKVRDGSPYEVKIDGKKSP